jgi:hypothetical protein
MKAITHNLTQYELKEYLSYDPLTGKFTWLKDRTGGIKTGDNAGHLGNDGYISIQLFKKRHKAHRLAWLYMTGNWPSDLLDHIDRNKSNNIFTNLREANISQNTANAKSKNSKYGMKNIQWHKKHNKWIANIRINGKLRHLGYFDDVEEAKRIVAKARTEFFGEFSCE